MRVSRTYKKKLWAFIATVFLGTTLTIVVTTPTASAADYEVDCQPRSEILCMYQHSYPSTNDSGWFYAGSLANGCHNVTRYPDATSSVVVETSDDRIRVLLYTGYNCTTASSQPYKPLLLAGATRWINDLRSYTFNDAMNSYSVWRV